MASCYHPFQNTRSPLDAIAVYLDNAHYLISGNRAERLCRQAGTTLPRHGYERRITWQGKPYWIARTQHHSETRWTIREA